MPVRKAKFKLILWTNDPRDVIRAAGPWIVDSRLEALHAPSPRHDSWSEADEQRLRELTSQGLSSLEISCRLARSESAIRSRQFQLHLRSQVRKGTWLSAEQLAELQRLWSRDGLEPGLRVFNEQYSLSLATKMARRVMARQAPDWKPERRPRPSSKPRPGSNPKPTLAGEPKSMLDPVVEKAVQRILEPIRHRAFKHGPLPALARSDEEAMIQAALDAGRVTRITLEMAQEYDERTREAKSSLASRRIRERNLRRAR